MADIASIINLVNTFAMAYSLEESEQSIAKLLDLFTEDASYTDEIVGTCHGKTEIHTALKERSELKFLADTRYLPSGHVVIMKDEMNATVRSSTIVFWKCTPVMLVEWEDEVVKIDGKWIFQQRKSESIQKNLEVIGEMQLRGKKQYANED